MDNGYYTLSSKFLNIQKIIEQNKKSLVIVTKKSMEPISNKSYILIQLCALSGGSRGGGVQGV